MSCWKDLGDNVAYSNVQQINFLTAYKNKKRIIEKLLLKSVSKWFRNLSYNEREENIE